MHCTRIKATIGLSSLAALFGCGPGLDSWTLGEPGSSPSSEATSGLEESSSSLVQAAAGTPFAPDPAQFYKIINNNSRYNLQPQGCSANNSVNIVQAINDNSNCQQWSFSKLTNGYFVIQNRTTGKVMDISGASKNDGAADIQYTRSGNVNQQWQIADMGNGFYSIKNINSGKLLEINGASTAAGAQAVQRTANSKTNQQWRISLVAPLPKNRRVVPKPTNARTPNTMTSLGRMANAGLALPAEFNWRDNGPGIGNVYDQGYCGDCWAFAAKSCYESKLLMKGYGFVDVSAQQQVSCNTAGLSNGCLGGLTQEAWGLWETNIPMLTSCTKYPDMKTLDVARTTSCSALAACSSSATGLRLPTMSGYYSIDPANIADVKASVFLDGPGTASIVIYSTSNDPNSPDFDLGNYWLNPASKGAVYTEKGTDIISGYHALTIVGWSDSKQAWLLKNSWAAGPNGDGTFWMAYSGHKHAKLLYAFENESVLEGNFWTASNGGTTPGVKRYVRASDGTYAFQTVPYPAGVTSFWAVAGDHRGQTYAIDNAGTVYGMTPKGGWTKIPGIVAADISTASNFSTSSGRPVLYVYAASDDGGLHTLNSAGNGWTKVDTAAVPNVKKVDVDSNGWVYVFAIGDGTIPQGVYRLPPGGTWQRMGDVGYVSDVASDPAYGTIVVGPYGHQWGVWKYNETTKVWDVLPNTDQMPFSVIDVGREGIVGLLDWQYPIIYANGVWKTLTAQADPYLVNVGSSSWR